MDAIIITIGDELLIGQVIDTNSAWIAAQLEKINIKVKEIRSIQDTRETILHHLKELSGSADVLLITGGLGPTKDDVTKHSIAEFLGDQLIFDEESFKRLTDFFNQFQRAVDDHHKDQCYVPESCTVLPNLMGTAQGMWMEFEGTILISMPGVPFEMKYIMENSVLPKLSVLHNGGKIAHKTIMTVGKGETWIEAQIKDIIDQLNGDLKIAYLPSLGRVRIRVSSFSDEPREQVAEVAMAISSRLGDIVYGYDEQPLEAVVGEMLKEKGLMVGTAESCTGGYLAHMITNVPGSSAYFKGSVLAYANEIKENILKVGHHTLEEFGAVSEQTVKEMVSGLIQLMDVDIAVATSGIAGPTGGTPEKPVGTVWLACGNREKIITERLQLSKDRLKNIEYSSIAALNIIRKFLTAQ